MKVEHELMRGATPLAVMKLLASGERYGYELVEALEKQADSLLAMGQSTLYPMLYNLEAKGLLVSRMAKADNGRERRYYRLTGKGKKRLASDGAQWQKLTQAMQYLGLGPESTAGRGALA